MTLPLLDDVAWLAEIASEPMEKTGRLRPWNPRARWGYLLLGEPAGRYSPIADHAKEVSKVRAEQWERRVFLLDWVESVRERNRDRARAWVEAALK